MLSDLFDSAPARGSLRHVTTWGTATSLVHAAMLAVLLGASTTVREPPQEPAPEVNYLELEEVEETPEEEPPQPAFVPEPPPESPEEPLPAGFQELVVPPDLIGITEEISVDSVRAMDFSGRGVLGGVGDGVVGAGPVAKTASELLPVEAELPSVIDSRFASEPPVLLDVERVSKRLVDLYPRLLRETNTIGTVMAEFVVLEDGHVDPESIRIIESDHPLFSAATRRAVATLRFKPGRMEWKGSMQAIRVRTRMPFNWSTN